MKRLFIVTLATLMATVSFAGVIAGEPMKKASEEVSKAREHKTATELGKIEKDILDKVVADLQSDRLKADDARVAIQEVFKGEDNQLIRSLAFQKALSEARNSTDGKVKESALFAEKLLSTLNSVTGEGYKEEIADVLLNYSTLLADMDLEGASKLNEHMKSMAFLTNPDYVAKLTASGTSLLSREDVRTISVARAMKADLKIAANAQVRTIKDLQDLGKLEEAKKKASEFTIACGKKRS